LQCNSVQANEQETTLPITEAELALAFAAATGAHQKERRWVALLSRIFVAAKESRSTRRPYRTQHGVNGTRANGTRDSATVSPLAIVSAPALTLVTATEPLELVHGEPESFIGGYSWQPSGPGFGTPGLNVGGGGT
jgi:hypothetical protein